MKILITGGLGYLGSWLTDFFCRYGHEVHVLSSSDNKHLGDLSYRFINADITEAEELAEKLDISFDCCLHAASLNDTFVKDYSRRALNVNALGTRNILEVLAGKGLGRFVYFSTFHVYGRDRGDLDEESPLNPRNDYASTHLFGEYYVRQFWNTHRVPYTILRPTNGYGAPRQLDSTKWYLVINDLARSAFERGEIVLNSNGLASRDFIWLGDVCNIVNSILRTDKTSGEVFNLSSGKNYRMIDIADIVRNVYETRYGRAIGIHVRKDDRTVYSGDLHVSNAKLRSFVDFEIHERIPEEIENIFSLLEKAV